MEIKLKSGSLKVNTQVISEMLGLKDEGESIMRSEVIGNEVMIANWKNKFPMDEEYITPSVVKGKIRKSKEVDLNFKLNFVMIYVDCTKCNALPMVQKRPSTTTWSREVLREREEEEIEAGGFGLGEKEPAYEEEEDIGFPEDLEGFVWKLGKYVETISKSRSCFEMTLWMGKEVFLGN
ncbi:hypothetical protein CTI12_AA149160 [Artemisia annua]|uniref:Uncharacterized protein n=1 Tax=Artemisia annua TaxID=35608 RepID=A0A2U1PI31_ARTAN|nr:hypothetical protein CTI12_AA149160 [Artemisia annua]